MNQIDYEIIHELREQSNKNQERIYNKTNFLQEQNLCCFDKKTNTSTCFIFSFKMIFFSLFLLVVTCYFYGGQNIKNGAELLSKDAMHYLSELCEKEPRLMEAIHYCKNGYRIFLEETKEYRK